MPALLVILHIIVCVALIMIVLLQTGKGADMGAAFGGGSSQTLFGSGGASTFLSKATTIAAIVFMLTSFGLAFLSSKQTGDSLVLKNKPPIQKQAETRAPGDSQIPAPAGGSSTNASPTETENKK